MSGITTYTKKIFDPCNPDSDLIVIEDIAHALSLLCRSGGHFPSFYSVGQHSIACAREAEARGFTKKVRLACLLHDASEAYIADITRPVKEKLNEYRLFEKVLQDKIYEKFLGFFPEPEFQKQVSDIDDSMLYYEFMSQMKVALFDKAPEINIKLSFEFRGFKEIEDEFLSWYYRLSD